MRLLALAVVALALAACSGPDAPRPGPTSSTSAPQPAAACSLLDLWIAGGPERIASGKGVTTFAVVNAGTTPCSVRGAPGVVLVGKDRQGRDLRVTAQATADAGNASEVSIGVGGVAYFDVTTAHVCQPDPELPSAAGDAEVSMGGESPALVAVAITVCRTASVGPFRSAFVAPGS